LRDTGGGVSLPEVVLEMRAANGAELCSRQQLRTFGVNEQLRRWMVTMSRSGKVGGFEGWRGSEYMSAIVRVLSVTYGRRRNYTNGPTQADTDMPEQMN
jgi:hypothetical protein